METATPSPNFAESLPQLSPVAGSTSWQLILVLLAALFLFTRVLRGMQLGGARQLVSMLALILGIAAGWLGGGAMVPIFRGMLGMPDFVIRGIGSASLCMFVIVVVEVMGMIFCGKTSEQTTARKRRLYAVSGMVIGFVNGSILIVLFMAGLSLLGMVANAKLVAQLNQLNQNITANPPQRNPNAPKTELDGKEGPLVVTTTLGDPLTVFLARLKNSADLGIGKDILDKMDPVPEEIHRMLKKTITVLSDPACSERLFQHPEISRISQHERIAQLGQNPEIQKLAQERDFLGLLRHPAIVEAANDPAVQKDFGAVDFEAALDYALAAHRDTISGALESGEVTVGTAP